MFNNIDIEVGSHVFADGFYREWEDLTEEQKSAFVKARDAVKEAFRGCEK